MENVTIKTATTRKEFTYVGEDLYVEGAVERDNSTQQVTTVNGELYTKEYGTDQRANYIGNFNGWMSSGQMKYDLHDMDAENTILAADLIAELGTKLPDIAAEEVTETTQEEEEEE